MEFGKLNLGEMESQRYKAIKKTGNYLELNILIGTEEDVFQEHTGKMPVIKTTMCNVGPEEIGCLYASLINLTENLEKKYPAECFLAKLSTTVTDIGSAEISMNKDKNE